MTDIDTDITAGDVAWDLEGLLDGAGDADALLDQAEELSATVEASYKGRVSTLDASGLAEMFHQLARISELASRAGHYVMLQFSVDTQDPALGAAMAKMQQRSTDITGRLIFVDLEWAQVDDDRAAELIADPSLEFVSHHLANMRKMRPHLLSEDAETVLNATSVTGAAAWVRLFEELTSSIEVELGEETLPLDAALSNLQHPDRKVRKDAAEAVSAGLEPGLRTRAFVYNTLLLDKSVDDKLRGFDSWVSSRNLSNEASDESVQALIDAVVGRYDIPHRWYALKAQVLGLDKLADYDRAASVADSDETIGWSEATGIVSDAYASFSDELASVVGRFLQEDWIDAPTRPGKRGGAFCAYTVPSHHPYVMLNWTGRTRDVLTLAHELGHGVHAYLARDQGIFHQTTPLTLAETASVFGETVTNNRLLSMLDDPGERFSLLSSTLEDSIATVFRQVAMNRFEDQCHTIRRNEGELSVERFGDVWAETQEAVLGDAVEITDGYRNWWSYVPHFMGTPGYVYAYAYGQLLALSVYARYASEGDAFVPAYLDLLRAGGSKSPEELGQIVQCDLADPGFWDAGLDIVQNQLDAATEAARAAGRI
ncbi:MAG: M3 family oligoendopeptidase [Acidimicrobiales bacterium]